MTQRLLDLHFCVYLRGRNTCILSLNMCMIMKIENYKLASAFWQSEHFYFRVLRISKKTLVHLKIFFFQKPQVIKGLLAQNLACKEKGHIALFIWINLYTYMSLTTWKHSSSFRTAFGLHFLPTCKVSVVTSTKEVMFSIRFVCLSGCLEPTTRILG